MAKSLCIIPARGGSKRIPKKNIKEFYGQPIIAYSIQTALNSGLFDQVMVSTDCSEIKDVGLEYGADVPFLRSASNADDFATTVDVVNEVLANFRDLGLNFEKVCVLYPCAPFVVEKDLQVASEMLDSYDGVVPVVKFDFPPLRSFKLDGPFLRYKWPEFQKARSQDLEDLYHDAGQWYFFKNSEQHHVSMIKDRTAPLLLDAPRVQDIDTMEDWKMAELKFQILRESL